MILKNIKFSPFEFFKTLIKCFFTWLLRNHPLSETKKYDKNGNLLESTTTYRP
ncbi:hypothetical protein SAMN04487898_105142 [Pedobacter sp. ok626]|nr:hypothetical protein SAMN04487898_105142 [Pedobacter sp. ok626]